MEESARWERPVELLLWFVAAAFGLLMLTQAVGADGFRLLATVQSLTPYLFPAAVIPAALAVWQRWYLLAFTSSMIGMSALVLAAPIVFAPSQPAPIAGADGLRVASINLLFSNRQTEAVADDLESRDLDVVTFSEYTAEHRRVLLDHPLADDFEYRVERTDRFASGVAVWSRVPLQPDTPPDTLNNSVDALVDGPDGPIRILAVHPPTPIFDFDEWKRDLSVIGRAAGASTSPTLVIGDFNASYWHPVFRDLLDVGLTDAHIADGRGWSTSWPTDEFFPPFVRLDHALTDSGLVSIDVEDFRVPGSDHAGLAVTVVPAR